MDVSSPSARKSFQNTDASLEASLESTRQTSSKPSMRLTQAALSGLSHSPGVRERAVLMVLEHQTEQCLTTTTSRT